MAELSRTGNPDDSGVAVEVVDIPKQYLLDPWDLLVALVAPLEVGSEVGSGADLKVGEAEEVSEEVSKTAEAMVVEGEELATKGAQVSPEVEVILVEIVAEVGIPDPTVMALLLQMLQQVLV